MHLESRITPEHPQYPTLYRLWKDGQPRRVIHARCYWMPVEENGVLVFIADGPVTQFDSAYGSTVSVT